MQIEKTKIALDFKYEKLEPCMDWIYFDDHPLLHQKALAFDDTITHEENELINRMVNYIDCCYCEEYKKYKIRPGIAIAGPQVGLLKRIIYIHFNDNDQEYRYLLVNPEIVAKSQTHSFIPGGEGCLSVPKDVKANIERNYKVIVKGYDLLEKKEVEISATNILSICLQHEIDHLDGILYTDHINKNNPQYYSKDWIKVD